MNFSFGNPALLPLAALIVVPVLVHLFARSRPRMMPFSSIRFIEELARKTSRIQQPKSWLILILRTLLFAALLGIFLKPILLSNTPLAGGELRKNVVIMVDATASMAAQEGARTRFAAATARASEIVSGLGPTDVANIVWINASPSAEFPSMAVSKEALRKALQSATISMEQGDLRAAFGKAESLLRGASGTGELHIISDFQASAWKDFVAAPIPGTRLILIKTGEGEIPNQALVEVIPSSRKALAGEDVEITCRLANHSSQPVLKRVYLRSGETSQSQEVRMQPWTLGSVTFSLRFAKPGEQAVELSMDEDTYPFDNTRNVVIDVLPHLTIGVAEGGDATASRWIRALRSLDWVRVEPVDNLAALPRCEVLMLGNWDGSHVETIRAFLDKGGTVVCHPSDGAPLQAIAALGGVSFGNGRQLQKIKLPEPLNLRITQIKHPAFALFASGDYGNPAGGKLSERLETPGGQWPQDGVLLSYQDGVPAIAEWGRFILWNIPLDQGEPRWSERVEFLPFLAELILASRQGAESGNRDFAPGQKIHRDFPADTLDEEVFITTSKGAEPARRDGAGNSVFSSKEPVGIGLYEWRVRDATAGFTAVDFPSVESDLRSLDSLSTLSPEAIALKASDRVSVLREGIPLWPWFLAAAMVLVLAESLAVWKTRPTL